MAVTPRPAPLLGGERVPKEHGPRQGLATPCPVLSLGNE